MKKAVYIALRINLDGEKEVLGLWIESSEGAKFWLSVLTELRNRGVQDFLFVCCDGLTGFPHAMETAFSKAVVQTCIVHRIRASLRYVSDNDRKQLVPCMRQIYGAADESGALLGLCALEERWGNTYPHVVRLWRSRWGVLGTQDLTRAYTVTRQAPRGKR